MSFDDLYQEVILDHYKNPRNFGPLDNPTESVKLFNPLCGDTITVDIRVGEDDRVEACSFHGHGCAISQASASMLTEQVRGKSREQALALIDRFKEAMRGERSFDELGDEIGEGIALQGVRKFPVRVKCATLAWNALQKALRGESGTEEVYG
ncbi:MAG: SUF system NifU family Fe-S cluster assembly protein [Planctomycetota bacterium]|nr:MAG: SUF system NifU family Fe-S cluster assembly protein [Planctomycetota bacterium]